MPYDLPPIKDAVLEKLAKPLAAHVQVYNTEQLKALRGSPLELKLVAQSDGAQSSIDYSVPCVVNGQAVDNCVDLVYLRAQSADEIYPGARVAGRNIQLATRHKFLFFKTGEWEKYFFNKEELSTKLQNIFREDPKVNFNALYNLFERFKGTIERVALFREGYMSIGIGKGNVGGYIIPISPETVDKVKSL